MFKIKMNYNKIFNHKNYKKMKLVYKIRNNNQK